MINSKNLDKYKHLLKYYSFDFDDNILHMCTVIHMDKLIDGQWIPVDLSTAEFASYRNDKANWRCRDNNPDIAYSEFRDTGDRGSSAFVEDIKKSISENQFGPSWDDIIECLENGSLFSIITARGHESETLKGGIEYIIDNMLNESQQTKMYAQCMKFAYLFRSKNIDLYPRIPSGQFSQNKLIQDYLNECQYYAVTCPTFIEEYNIQDPNLLEESKALAMKIFVEKIHNFSKIVNAKFSLGFSDDDIKNVEHMYSIFKDELSLKYAMNYRIYNTSDRTIKGGQIIHVN